MRSRKGFTLVELMVVVLIIGILAAAAIPIVRGRIDAAKWSEGKATLGTIATALRAYASEKGADGVYGYGNPSLATLGFNDSDLHGMYFTIDNYLVVVSSYDATRDPALMFTILATHSTLIPHTITLNQAGNWGGQ